MWTLTKQFRFEASHLLPNHDGKCARLHGHSWIGYAAVRSSILHTVGSKAGMVMDYADIGEVIKPMVEKYLDHWHLNDSLKLVNPTSEEIAKWIYDHLKTDLPVFKIIIEETCTSRCEYSEEI